MISSLVDNLFPGIPLFFQLLFAAAVLVIAFVLFWSFLLFVKGFRAKGKAPDPGGEDDINWVFLIPALNEEVTIADSVERLKNLKGARKKIVVINDGSDDNTEEIVEELKRTTPELTLLNRRAPDAKRVNLPLLTMRLII